MATKFRAHETFFIRKGWLSKGMRYVSQKPDVFTNRDDNPMDVLESVPIWLNPLDIGFRL